MAISELMAMLDGMAGGTVQKHRIALLRDQVQAISQELVRLQEENARLVERNTELHRDLEKASVSDEFVEHRGVLFRRLPTGNLEDTVYCPACKAPMTSLMDALPFSCSLCNRAAGFEGHRLTSILKEMDQRV